MCLEVDMDDTVTLASGWRAARKPHRCKECRRVIDPKERYWDATVLEDDQVTTEKMCAHCRATIDVGCALTGCPAAWYWGQIHDLGADDGGFVGDIIANHELARDGLIVMAAAVLHARKGWRRRDGTLFPVPAIQEA